jgi:hypothetical protein
VTESLAGEKQQIMEQLRATLTFMPDNPQDAEQLRSWLSFQLDVFLDTLTHDDLSMPELMGTIATLGPAFSRVLPDRKPTLPEGFPVTPNSIGRLRAVS